MKGILLATHSQYKPVCTKIATALPPAEYDVIIVDENTPQALAAREEAVRWCAMFVIVGSVRYQRNPYCLELANYAKTIRKPIITILAQNKYKPFGAIGAISVAGATVIDFTNDFLNAIEILKKELESKAWATDLPKPNLAESGSAANSQKTSKSSAGVLISYQKDAWHVAEMIKSVLGLATTYINPSQKSGQEDAISGCQVFVAVLSPDYQSSAVSQRCYEMARVYRKRIIPVIGSAKYQPSDWLALAIAGKLYYAMPDRESAYKKFYDSSLINDFRYAVEAFLQPHASEEEREAKEIQALDKQLEECKGKLPSWPPKPRPQETKVDKVESAMKNITVGEGKKDLPFNYIHHEVTRMSFVPPKPLFDARGVPLRRKFDAMCSYQWSIQDFVRDLYMDLHMRSLEVWMDIWGGMQGNINEAMANAVECSTTMICFLTAKYQQSVNCCLELKYALSRGKPIVFIRVEPKLSLLPWISDVVARSKVFELSSISDAGKMDDGIPRVNRISELIREYTSRGPAKVLDDDVTEEVHARREMLEDALYWIHQNQGTARYSKCGRCGGEFDDNSLEGCKQHDAYFMGGTIIAGRWVCCGQRSKDSPGCKKTKHTTTVLQWKEIPGYGGCYKWQ